MAATASRRRGPDYHNELFDLKAASEAGSQISSGGASKVSKGSAWEPPADNAFDVKARRPPSPTGTASSFGSRRGSRPLVGPSHQQAVASALAAEAGETSGEEEEDKGFHGLKTLTDGLTGLGALMGMKKEEALDLPDKRDPGFKGAVTKYLYTQHPMLTTLDLSDAALADGDMPRLSDAIGSNTVIKSVSLATNSLTHESMPDLVNGFERNVSLRAIDLGENAIGVRGAALLARNLDRKTQLIGLDLASNLIRDEGCRAVLDSLQQTPGQPIQWLSISENSISDHSAADIASLIDCAKNLTFLDVSRNAFFSNGMRVMAEELGLNHTLKHLNISNINLGAEAVELLAASIGRNRGLISLDMYACSVGDVGAKAMGAALARNTTLRRLDLGSNKIGSSGCALLADGLMVNTVLHVLRLWGNNLGLACERLLSALYTNDTLIQIDLTGCSTDVDTVSMIAALVKKNRLAENGRGHGRSEIRALRKALAKEQGMTDALRKKAKGYKKKLAQKEVEAASQKSWGGGVDTGYDSALSMDSDGGAAGKRKGTGLLQRQDSISSVVSDESQEKAWWDLGSLGKGLPISTPGLPSSFDFFGNATSTDSRDSV